MSRLETIKEDLRARFPNHPMDFSNAFGNDVLHVKKDVILLLLKHLKETKAFDILLDVCGIDHLEKNPRFEVVYHLLSTKDQTRLRIKTMVGENETIDSAIPAWKSANWFERETYDMFGIIFKGHPNLTKILTHHHFKGHPLRKDYDPNHQQHCTEAAPMQFEYDPNYIEDMGRELLPLNLGPSHPATHGTLRVMAALDGERVVRVGVELGFLHRCFEKMAETHSYNQVIPYTDRLNYCSAPMNNIGYCKTVEKMLGVEIPARAQAFRILLAELSRVIDHCVCISANAVDLGALTGFFHLFGIREKVYSLFEKLCGARLTVSMTRVGGMAQDAPEGWFEEVLKVCNDIDEGAAFLDKMLTGNKIWIERTMGVGKISAQEAIDWGFTGPLLRSTGVSLDFRKATPYYGYDNLDFDIPVGTNGDVFDTYLVRVEEMRQSCRIIRQVCKNMPGGDYSIRDKAIVLPEKKDVYGNIEGLMNHFMLIVKGIHPPKGEIYDSTEAANGELGFYLISDGSAKPNRLHVRSPSFAHYQAFPQMVRGGLVADVIAVLGNMNLIAGELDR